MKHIWKIKGCFCQKGQKWGEFAKGNFSKITETAHWEPPRKAAYWNHSIAIHSISMAGYVTTVLALVRVFCPQLSLWTQVELMGTWQEFIPYSALSTERLQAGIILIMTRDLIWQGYVLIVLYKNCHCIIIMIQRFSSYCLLQVHLCLREVRNADVQRGLLPP